MANKTFTLNLPDGLDEEQFAELLGTVSRRVEAVQTKIDKELARQKETEEITMKVADAVAFMVESLRESGIELADKRIVVTFGSDSEYSFRVQSVRGGAHGPVGAKGLQPRRGNGPKKAVVIDGTEYPSSTEACEALGLEVGNWGPANTLKAHGIAYQWA